MEEALPAQRRPHCLVVPFPIQGHLNPILQFSTRCLIPRGIRVTIANTRFISATAITAAERDRAAALDIGLETISDGHDDGGIGSAKNPASFDGTFREVWSKTLSLLLDEKQKNGDPVHCVIYDSSLPWCLDVAKNRDGGGGILAAAFFTESCAVNSIYYQAAASATTSSVAEVLTRHEFPQYFQEAELPSSFHHGSNDGQFLTIRIEEFSNIRNADWLLFNTVHELEPKEFGWLSKFLPVATIGPTIPSMLSNNRDDHGLITMFKPNNEDCAANWLQTKPKASVVYVSFGSITRLGPDQIEELFWGLSNSKHYFLWVVRQFEQSKLPTNFSAVENKKGLIVPWCSQLEVLASESVGCFVTHCGWNSTLELVCAHGGDAAVVGPADQCQVYRGGVESWGEGGRWRRRRRRRR